MRESRDERAQGIDFPGVVTVTIGLFGLVFGIIEAGRYGWFKPIGDQSIGGWEWPVKAFSIVPVALAIGALGIVSFVLIELARARAGQPVVFDFGDLRHRGFRYGLINTMVLAMGEFGAFFVLPIFLQAGLGLSAVQSGSWLLPAGIMAFFGGFVGGQLSRRFGPKYVITVGLAFEATGIFLYVAAFSTSTTFLQLLPGLVLHGIGIGFATSQLTNVVLSDIPPQKAGSASGASGMVRQVGTALGIALIGAIFVSQAASNVRTELDAIAGLPATGQGADRRGRHRRHRRRGRVQAPPGVDLDEISDLVSAAVADASRPAVAFAGFVVVVGALLSLLVPNIPPDEHDMPSEMAMAGGSPPDPTPPTRSEYRVRHADELGEPRMKQLTGIDASFLYMETDTTYGHVSGLLIFDRPYPDFDPYAAVYERYEAMVGHVEPMRRRLVEVPFSLDHPWWIEDPNFDLSFHIRALNLAKPGYADQLADQVARIHGGRWTAPARCGRSTSSTGWAGPLGAVDQVPPRHDRRGLRADHAGDGDLADAGR